MKTSFHIIPVQPPFDQWIQFIWVSEGEDDQTKTKILPNGAIELIINFGRVQHILDNETLEVKNTYTDFWVAGLQTKPIIIQSADDTNLVGIRFLPGGAYPFFKFPVSRLTDKVIEADWISAELVALRKEIGTVSNMDHIGHTIHNYLALKFDGTAELNASVKYVADTLLFAEEDQPAVAGLIKKAGYSHKHFLELFKKQVGTSPKNLQRIIRLQKVIQMAKAAPDLKWSDILLNFPFYDAAHFAHDFKDLTGMTADKYLELRTFDENHCLLR